MTKELPEAVYVYRAVKAGKNSSSTSMYVYGSEIEAESDKTQVWPKGFENHSFFIMKNIATGFGEKQIQDLIEGKPVLSLLFNLYSTEEYPLFPQIKHIESIEKLRESN